MDYGLIGYVKASKHRIDLLRLIDKYTLTPKDVSNILKIHISQASRTLNELVEKNLVKCETPYMKKGRVYSITEMGRECLNSLKR